MSPSFPRFKASGHHGHLRFEPHVQLTSSRAEEAAITTQQFESVMLVMVLRHSPESLFLSRLQMSFSVEVQIVVLSKDFRLCQIKEHSMKEQRS